MDAAPRGMRSSLAPAILGAVAVLVAVGILLRRGLGDECYRDARDGGRRRRHPARRSVGCRASSFSPSSIARVPLPVAAAVGLVVWTGLTVWWSIAGDRSFAALGKGIVLLAFGVVGLAASVLPGRPLRSVALVFAGALGALLCWSLLGKVVPALGPDDAGRVARLRGPIGYWNALALLADAALGLGLWLVATVRERGARPLGALLLYTATLTILLTQSRAGLVAGVAVVALALVLMATRVEAALFALLACVPGLLVAGWAFTRHALVEDGAISAELAVRTGPSSVC